MTRKKNTKTLYVVALVLLLGGVGYLAVSGMSENSVYFLNVSEALAAPQGKQGTMRLFGTVAEQDLQTFKDSPGVRFLLEDKDNKTQTMLVSYHGAVPDTFKAGAEVIVEGGINADKVFQAKTLMTKCPSKYEKENRG